MVELLGGVKEAAGAPFSVSLCKSASGGLGAKGQRSVLDDVGSRLALATPTVAHVATGTARLAGRPIKENRPRVGAWGRRDGGVC